MTKHLFFLMTYIQRRIKLHILLQPFLTSHKYCPFGVGCAVNRIEANGHVHRLSMAQENEMDVSQLVAPFSSAVRAAYLCCEYSRCLLKSLFSLLCFSVPLLPIMLSSASQALFSPLLMIHWDAHVSIVDYTVSWTIAQTIYRIPVIYAIYLLWHEE